MTPTSFKTLSLEQDMLENLDSLGYTAMTPIQAKSLPFILEGRDLIARAKTGSGKTAAFGIGLLEKLNVAKFSIQAAVLCPTRELADQVAKELRRLARGTHNIKILTLSGGVPLGPQRHSLEHGAHIIVGTPGRIQDHLGKGTLALDDLNMLVLDEADRMLDMGFYDAIIKIVSNIPKKRQTLLFSATFPKNIEAIAKEVMQNPVSVMPEESRVEKKIEQLYIPVGRSLEEKIEKSATLLHHLRPSLAILFCNTKLSVDECARELCKKGIHAKGLHGDLEQSDRTETLVLFSNGSIPVLVATDVAARGLDINDMDLVVNIDLPHDPEVYMHRIGRTGRAGKKGRAVTLLSPYDAKKRSAIETYQKAMLQPFELPEKITEKTLEPRMQTLCIFGGKKEKLRPGDILGALIKDAKIKGEHIGKIDIFGFYSYVAIERSQIDEVIRWFERGKIKKRSYKTKICR
ncbi:ATP-dependent RNA helicase DbpA [Hydrogenimonas sp.]